MIGDPRIVQALLMDGRPPEVQIAHLTKVSDPGGCSSCQPPSAVRRHADDSDDHGRPEVRSMLWQHRLATTSA